MNATQKQYTIGKLRGAKTRRNETDSGKKSVSLKLITRNCKIQWSILIFQGSLKNWLDILSGYYSREAVFETQMKIHYFMGLDHSKSAHMTAVFCLYSLTCLRARSSNVKNQTDNYVVLRLVFFDPSFCHAIWQLSQHKSKAIGNCAVQ